MYTINLTEGVDLHIVKTDKFNTITFCFLLRTPLKFSTATSNALIAKSILNGTSNFKNQHKLEIHLENIDTIISSEILKKGEEHIVELYVKTTKNYLEEAVKTLGDIVLNPLFNNIDSAKIALKNTILSQYNNKRVYALNKFIENMCKEEAYSINGDGYVEDIEKISPHKYYKELLLCSKIDIIALGNIDEVLFTNYIKKHIPLSPRKITLTPCEYIYTPEKIKNINENIDITQAKLCIGFRANVDPISNDWYKLVLANELFGGSANSAIFMEARESQSLCYYISSKLLRYKSIMVVEAGIDHKNKDKVVNIIKKAISNISEDNLEIAKTNIINSYKMAQDEPERIIDLVLGGLIAGQITSFEEAIENIKSIKSTDNILQNCKLDTIYMLGKEDINAWY